MKKFLITTVLGIATTAAFGAASLRAPQIGGTATVATPTATNTARAGTMRTQTMKTSSVSAPSVTTTQSIATPVSTETTDARIALLKGIKGFNPGKIKDTATATSELNSLNDRIEELTAQLDRAEAAQSTVLTEDTIDTKIEQKLSQLGTSTGTKDTYSKEEVNALLSNIVKKLPQIDDKGNMTWTDPNGNLITNSIYYINLVNEADFLLLSFVQDQGMVSQPIAHISTYHTNKTDTAIQQYVSTTVCSGETSKWCSIISIDPINNGEAKEVKVVRLIHGGDLIASVPEYYGYTPSDYWTFEDSPKEYVRSRVCGDMPENECNLNDDPNYSYSRDVMGEAYGLANQFQKMWTIRVNKLTRKYMDLNWQIDGRIVNGQPDMYTSSNYTTNMSTDEIEEYVSNIPCHDETPGTGWCVISQTQQNNMFGVPYTWLLIARFHHGYKQGSIDYITNNNTRVQNFVTIEDNAEGYILDQICGNRPSSECHLLPNHQTDCRSLSAYHSSRQICDVFIERSPEQGTGWYLPATPADD